MATASSNLGVAFASGNSTMASISGNTVTLKSGGTVVITASQGGDSTYNAAPSVTQNLTIIDDTVAQRLLVSSFV